MAEFLPSSLSRLAAHATSGWERKPDDTMLKAALLQHGANITCEDLAVALGWRSLESTSPLRHSTNALLHLPPIFSPQAMNHAR